MFRWPYNATPNNKVNELYCVLISVTVSLRCDTTYTLDSRTHMYAFGRHDATRVTALHQHAALVITKTLLIASQDDLPPARRE
jgi:hypothetical protein